MILKTRNEIKSLLTPTEYSTLSEHEGSTISKLKTEFMKQINEDPDEEYKHVYFHQIFTNAFKRENRKNTFYKTLFVLTGSAFLISFNFLTPLTYYLLFMSIIFAAQFD